MARRLFKRTEALALLYEAAIEELANWQATSRAGWGESPPGLFDLHSTGSPWWAAGMRP